MTDVLAAVDDSPAAPLVVRTARQLADVLGGTCRALHVQSGGAGDARHLIDVGDTELTLVDGDPATEIERAARDASVGVVVVAARGRPEGPTPVGHVATTVVECARKPVMVVPPSGDRAVGHVRRVLIPLEGTPDTSTPIVGILTQLADAGAIPVALHVFDAQTVPRFWDDLAHSGDSFASEFASRWWYGPGPIEVRLLRGEPPTAVVDVAAREGVDLIVLGWAQDLSVGHAEVVRAALATATVPVLLVPTGVDTDEPEKRPAP